jgi:hypothetical protein
MGKTQATDARLPCVGRISLMRVTVSLFGILVALLTMMLSRCCVLLGFLVLPVGVMVGRLQMRACCGLMVMLEGQVFGVLCHSCCRLQGVQEGWPLVAQGWASVSEPVPARGEELLAHHSYSLLADVDDP